MIILPKMHIEGALSKISSGLNRYTDRVSEAIQFLTISMAFGPTTAFIEQCASTFVQYIHFNGHSTEMRRRIGPNWESEVILAIKNDFLCLVSTLDKIENDESLFFERVEQYLKGMCFTQGSKILLSILSASTQGFIMPGTKTHINFSFKLRKGYAKQVLGSWAQAQYKNKDEFERIQSLGFRDPRLFGVLKEVSNIIPEFKLYNLSATSGTSQQICVGDLVHDESDGTLFFLHSDGTSPISDALNLVMNTVMSDPFKEFSFKNTCFYTIPNPVISSTVKGLMLEIWLGINFSIGTLQSSGGVNSPKGKPPSPDEGPLGPTNPPSGPLGPDEGTPPTPDKPSEPNEPKDTVPPSSDTVSEISQEISTESVEAVIGISEDAKSLDAAIKSGNKRIIVSSARKLIGVANSVIPIATLGLLYKVKLEQNPNYISSGTSKSISIGSGPMSISHTKTISESKPYKDRKKSLV
jgi:hypothetical protein